MDDRKRVLPNGFLTISPVHRTDMGEYTCIARNSLGTDRTRGILRVFNRPKLYIRPNPVYDLKIGQSIELPCMAITDPQLDLAYKWQHNGLRIIFDKMPQYSMGKFRMIISSLILNFCYHFPFISWYRWKSTY